MIINDNFKNWNADDTDFKTRIYTKKSVQISVQTIRITKEVNKPQSEYQKNFGDEMNGIKPKFHRLSTRKLRNNKLGRSSDFPGFRRLPIRRAANSGQLVENTSHKTGRDYSYGDSSRLARDSLLIDLSNRITVQS